MDVNFKKKEQVEDLKNQINDQSKALKIEPVLVEESENNFNNIFENMKNDFNLLKDKYSRLCAEFENFKKRSNREIKNNFKYANEAILTEMLPILDHLEQAILLGENENKYNDVMLGIKMVLKQFKDILKKTGIEKVLSVGNLFNPVQHEAIIQKINDNVNEGIILEEYQKGYTLNGRLIRPARVVVSKKSK